MFSSFFYTSANQVDEPSKAFDLIVSTRPGMLKEFQPKTKCLGGKRQKTKKKTTKKNSGKYD